jgi:LacI family transcriptional regulator
MEELIRGKAKARARGGRNGDVRAPPECVLRSNARRVKSFTVTAPSRGVVTIKDVAARAGLSVAAVSYALRDHSKVAPATRVRVQAIAQGLGYRPNPRVASLMAHIRRSQLRDAGEQIAFVWMHTTRAQAASEPFLRKVFAGARQRAEQVGFALEQFWTSDRGMSERRLAQILHARGIVGVVLSPVTTSEAAVTLDWDWSRFAAAVIGNVTWTPELHHAGHHHYLGMRMALLELAKLGCRRPAAIVDAPTHERAKRAWEGSFLAHHPAKAKARGLWAIHTPGLPRDYTEWLKDAKPDALIVHTGTLLTDVGLKAYVRRSGLPVVALYWTEEDANAGIGGVDQCYDRVAAHAVDLVVAQLNNNEAGAPDLPRMMLFPGRWVPPRLPVVNGAAG